ncbi:MAG: hypothetical protein LBR73_00280 [Oscillospiraceae bacterium]|nr:hypothetical protein [Oscillospiraceae bacterium]
MPLRADWQPDSLKAITDPDVQSFSVLDYTFYYYEDADLNPVYITVTDPDGNVLTKEEWPVVFSALGVGENASQTDG